MKIKTNTKALDIYQKGMGLIPKKVPWMVTSVLNKQAVDMTNVFIPQALENNFMIRDKRFMKKQVWTNFAKKNKNPSTNFSESGSLSSDRFTGWEEQQTGKAPEKKRTATTDVARGGSFAKKQRPSTRMKKGTFRKQSQYQGRSKKHRMFNMIRETKKQKLNFIISHGEGNQLNIPDGLYMWRGQNLKMIQSFKTPKTVRKDWMNDALALLIKHRGGFDREFERTLDFVIRKNFKGLL